MLQILSFPPSYLPLFSLIFLCKSFIILYLSTVAFINSDLGITLKSIFPPQNYINMKLYFLTVLFFFFSWFLILNILSIDSFLGSKVWGDFQNILTLREGGPDIWRWMGPPDPFITMFHSASFIAGFPHSSLLFLPSRSWFDHETGANRMKQNIDGEKRKKQKLNCECENRHQQFVARKQICNIMVWTEIACCWLNGVLFPFSSILQPFEICGVP